MFDKYSDLMVALQEEGNTRELALAKTHLENSMLWYQSHNRSIPCFWCLEVIVNTGGWVTII